MHHATKRLEIEILLKAGLPRRRVAEVSLRTVHRIRAEFEARSAGGSSLHKPIFVAADLILSRRSAARSQARSKTGAVLR